VNIILLQVGIGLAVSLVIIWVAAEIVNRYNWNH
jgi:hypothetical protein